MVVIQNIKEWKDFTRLINLHSATTPLEKEIIPKQQSSVFESDVLKNF